MYQPIATTWRFYDNWHESGPRLIADRRYAQDEIAYDEETWSKIRASMPDRREPPSDEWLAAKLADNEAITAAIRRGFYKAVIRHRQANVPMIFGDNGKTIEVSPFDVPIPSDTQDKQK